VRRVTDSGTSMCVYDRIHALKPHVRTCVAIVAVRVTVSARTWTRARARARARSPRLRAFRADVTAVCITDVIKIAGVRAAVHNARYACAPL